MQFINSKTTRYNFDLVVGYSYKKIIRFTIKSKMDDSR